ncbi:MAG: aminotransferase class IV [Cyclobacteriaceae bacterium]
MELIASMAFCYFNGKLVDEAEASISIHNLGVHRGFGIFDFFRAKNGKPTFFEDYLNRFDDSQRFLHLSRHISKEEVQSAVRSLLKKNGFASSSLKLLLLGDGVDADDEISPLFFIINAPFEEAAEISETNLILEDYVRENATIKSINYFTSYQVHRRKKKYNALDVLYHKNGVVSEASRSNVFIIKDGVLLTPEKNILHGITRKHILEIAKGLMEIRIQDVTVDEVLNADEVFISGTIKEVMPVLKIDDQVIGTGRPGAETIRLHHLFKERVADYHR